MKRHRDRYCSDGVIDNGERIVRAGGVVKFDRRRWRHEKLLSSVHMGDYWATEVFASDRADYIAHLEEVKA